MYSSPNISVMIKSKIIWAEHVAGMGEKGGTYRLLVVRLGRSRCRWEDNIKMNLKKWNGEAWNAFIWLRTETADERL